MSTIRVSVVPVTINDHYSYTWVPFEDTPIEQEVLEIKKLDTLKAHVQQLVNKYEEAQKEVMISCHILQGRSPNGFKAWKQQVGAILADPFNKQRKVNYA